MDTGLGTGAAQGPAPSQPQHTQVSALAAHLNQQTRGAKKAQRDCADLYLLLSLHSCASTPTAAASICCESEMPPAGSIRWLL